MQYNQHLFFARDLAGDTQATNTILPEDDVDQFFMDRLPCYQPPPELLEHILNSAAQTPRRREALHDAANIIDLALVRARKRELC
ncbi:MAG: hypothetical protein H0W02_20050 [Ktedonobacteraceae bacterium]|nr:hypothetical protein [Ktedonobacteraceae bacterium]